MQHRNTMIAGIATVVIAAALLFSWVTLDDQENITLSERFIDAIDDGNYEALFDMLDDSAKETIGDSENLGNIVKTSMAQLESAFGGYLGKTDTHGTVPTSDETGDYTVLLFERSGVRLITGQNEGKVTSFFFNVGDKPSDAVLPENLSEKTVSIKTNDLWELPGLLTTSNTGSKTAAVLVHGSGAHGMNCEIGGNMIFQQIAWGLADKGIDVLRYDKRTYADPFLTGTDPSLLDIQFETIDDAVSAGKMLKSMGYEKVYVIGHSLGAMMVPAIVEQSEGAFDGMISLAGSPRSLSEIQYDQNMASISIIEDPVLKQQYLDIINGEMTTYRNLASMSEEEVMKTTIFGLPAYYVRSMVSLNIADTARSLDVPMLFLQGKEDFQVDPEKDYGAWIDILDDKESASFMLYLGLNHLFCISTGPGQGTVDEYYNEMIVNPTVINDIVEFMLSE